MSRNTLQIVVAGLIENLQGEILLIKRNNKGTSPNFWEDAGGKLLQSEKPDVGLKREIREETGLTDIEIVKPLTVFHNYLGGVKIAEKEFIGISYWCKTKTTDVKSVYLVNKDILEKLKPKLEDILEVKQEEISTESEKM